MPKITVIPIDGAVYKDGVTYIDLDLSSCNIPEDVHALQWFGEAGWVEFTDTRPNEDISALPVWCERCLDKWQEEADAVHEDPEAPVDPETKEV
jgi:hypothetical protein